MVILMLGAQKKMTDQPCKRDALHKGQHDPCKRVYSNFLGAANNVEKKAGAPVDLAILLSNKQLCTGYENTCVLVPKKGPKTPHLLLVKPIRVQLQTNKGSAP